MAEALGHHGQLLRVKREPAALRVQRDHALVHEEHFVFVKMPVPVDLTLANKQAG